MPASPGGRDSQGKTAAITGCNHNLSPNRLSVVYEAGFREFDALARDEMIKLGDRLRRIDDGQPSRATTASPVGPAWVARLFRDGCMPTAQLRETMCSTGIVQHAEFTAFYVNKRENAAEGAALAVSSSTGTPAPSAGGS